MLNVDKLRLYRGSFSQAEVAHRGKVRGGAQAVSNLENGRVKDLRLSTLLALAKGLRCSIADLVDEEYPPRKRAVAK
jgi:DNA-binding Xre family transcriptional regulator